MEDLEIKYKKATENLTKIENQINDRLWELTQKYPQAVIYEYKADTQLENVKAIIFSTKRQFLGIKTLEKLNYIKAIEKHIESLNPRRQLKLNIPE